MSVIGDDDPDPSLVMCDLWYHWQPVASLAARAPYPPPADVQQVRTDVETPTAVPRFLNSPQVSRLTADATAAWSEGGALKEKWARALAAYAALQLLQPQDFEVSMMQRACAMVSHWRTRPPFCRLDRDEGV
jgi:hypothetical protein